MHTVCMINEAVAFKQKLNTTTSMPEDETWQWVPMKHMLAQGWNEMLQHRTGDPPEEEHQMRMCCGQKGGQISSVVVM
eukprot:5452913-Ditylum_brightwellii.AAC.1